MARAPENHGPHRLVPLLWALLVLGVVAVVYAVLAEEERLVLVAAVVAATILGGILGTATRDSQERVVSVGYSLREGLRRLGHRLWY